MANYYGQMESMLSPQPLVLVHAWGECGRSFDRLIKLLPASLAPIAVDLPGDVSTGADSTDCSVESLVGHLATRLESVNSHAAHSAKSVVLGSSSGGYLAQQLAVDHPDLLEALILVGSPFSLEGRPEFADDVERLTDPVDIDWVREFFGWFPLHHPVPARYINDRIRDAATIPAQIWRDTLSGLYEATPPLKSGRISAPTLVIAGGNDQLLGSAHLDLVAAIPNARTVVYEDTGHLVLWERPERIVADVVMFLNSIDQQI